MIYSLILKVLLLWQKVYFWAVRKKESFVLRHFFGRWSLAMDRYFFPISNTYQTKPVQLGGLPKWWWWFFGEFFGHQGLLQDLQLYNLQMTSITRSTAITAADRGVGWGKKPRMLGGRVGGSMCGWVCGCVFFLCVDDAFLSTQRTQASFVFSKGNNFKSKQRHFS